MRQNTRNTYRHIDTHRYPIKFTIGSETYRHKTCKIKKKTTNSQTKYYIKKTSKI